MTKKTKLGIKILWIEEQSSEYDPLLDTLQNEFGLENLKTADTEDAGYKLLKTISFDLVILDIMLPISKPQKEVGLVSLNAGVRILNDLRNNLNWATKPDCGIVVLTARPNIKTLQIVQLLIGDKGCLIQKPGQIEIIMNTIRNQIYGGF